MMNFSDLLFDLKKLEGMNLSSIRPGAEIIIEKVDDVLGKVIIKTVSGKLHSRSISEFQKIWDSLMSFPAIHVDEVLHGSGSSRNQPETIFANLPYIEWLKVNNKKHISYVGVQSHPYGTIKKMDSISADKISEKGSFYQANDTLASIVSTRNISQVTTAFSKFCGKNPLALTSGTYSYNLTSGKVIFIDSDIMEVPIGTYCPISVSMMPNCSKSIAIDGITWGIIIIGEFKGLVKLS